MIKRMSGVVVSVLSAGFASVSLAAVPAAVGTGLTQLETDGLAVIDLVWPIVITLVGAMILIKLFKRASSKI